jgi:hypothetical protein
MQGCNIAIFQAFLDCPMIETVETTQTDYRIACRHLPLAVYREVAAHLRQVEGVSTELLPQHSQQFDYLESQVGGLWIHYKELADLSSRHRVDQILAYYGDRYGEWQEIQA